MDLEACLPAELRGPETTISRIAAGLSGAGVYRVEAGGQVFVLKIAGDDEPIAVWRHRTELQALAGSAGLAPRVVHTDEARRAVVTAFVADQSFFAQLGNPGTREAALVQLGQTLRRVHDLPLPPGATSRDPRELITMMQSALAGFALPGFVGEAIARALAEVAPVQDRAVVLSHNDVNPSNLVYDGEHLMLLDWDTAGPNDPLYDLAAIAVFLRMDEATCRALIEAHDGAPVAALPARFSYNRRVVAVMCGAVFLHLARKLGHAGAVGGETLEATPSLGEIYPRLRSGSLDLGSGDGRWAFGLGLIKDSFGL